MTGAAGWWAAGHSTVSATKDTIASVHTKVSNISGFLLKAPAEAHRESETAEGARKKVFGWQLRGFTSPPHNNDNDNHYHSI